MSPQEVPGPAESFRSAAETQAMTRNVRRSAATQCSLVSPTCLRAGAETVVVLGGAHDLTDNVKRLGGGKVGLIVVTTQAFRRFAEEPTED